MSNNVITITIEGISTALVGTYGSNTAVTPAIDALAAHGIVLDQCYVDSLDTKTQLRSLWTGQHALSGEQQGESVWEICRRVGRSAVLITDCPVAASWAEVNGCEQVSLVSAPVPLTPAEDAADCSVLALFTAAASFLGELALEHEPMLVWVHSRGLQGSWDAPLALRRQFVDLEDPDPPSEVGPPGFEVSREVDPDDVVGWGQVAAAQMAVIDEGVSLLQGVLKEARHSWAWVLAGLGGVPLGEHGYVGWGRRQLHAEELQVTAIILTAPHPPIGLRRAELCQLPDLGRTIAECCSTGIDRQDDDDVDAEVGAWGRSLLKWFAETSPHEWGSANQTALVRSDTQTWLRTPAWSLLVEEEEGQAQLFVKPDDRWEVSDVSSRCADVVAQMKELAQQFMKAVRENRRSELPQLDPVHCNLIR